LGLFLLCGAVYGAELQGVVSAESRGVPLSGAVVVLRGAGREWRAVTGAQGVYRFQDLDAAARYSLEASAEGFRLLVREDVRLTEESEHLDLKLTLSDFRQSVVVEAGILRVDSNAPELSQTIDSQALRELPSGNRNLTKVALLDAHVRQVVGLGGDGNNGYRLSFNAGSYRHTSFLLDGVINYDWIFANGPYQPVSLGAAEEMQVITNQYSAQYGTTTTGAVNKIIGYALSAAVVQFDTTARADSVA